ncbi:MAG: RluA family pseudouridine synthase [Clostridia bacterium]|nr:RluA family pseudouridine synthase [Clostridia bacterium]
MKTFSVPFNCNLKDFTDSVYPQGSFAFSQLLRNKDIKVNGVRVNKNVPLKSGDTVIYYTSVKQEEKLSHRVVYEDENVLIADKFSGVSSEALLCELCQKGDFRLAHRLDRNTCGLITFAKNDAAEQALKVAFKERTVEKTYLCFCKNSFKKKHEFLTAFLKKDEKASLVKISSEQNNGYVKIATEYQVLKSMGDYALVEVLLHTGKTHQIRAHTAFIGCPVLGDEKYGDEKLNAKYGAKRQCLVAKRLCFKNVDSLGALNGKTFESEFIPELPKKNG